MSEDVQDRLGQTVLVRDNDVDRGHLLRRRDPGWGTELEAPAATEATFGSPRGSRRRTDITL